MRSEQKKVSLPVGRGTRFSPKGPHAQATPGLCGCGRAPWMTPSPIRNTETERFATHYLGGSEFYIERSRLTVGLQHQGFIVNFQ